MSMSLSLFIPFSTSTRVGGEGNGTPLQYSCLENPMDGGTWWAAVHGVAKSLTWLRDFIFTFHFHALEKEMATHSSVLAWRIPGTGEPGGLQSMGLLSRTRLKWLSSSSSSSSVFTGLLLWVDVARIHFLIKSCPQILWHRFYYWSQCRDKQKEIQIQSMACLRAS